VALDYLDAGKPQGVLGKSRTAGAAFVRRLELGSAPEQVEQEALGDGWPFRVSEIDVKAALANRSRGEEEYGQRWTLANRSRREVLSMTMGLVGRKCGMTRVFTEDGDSIPVTVIEAQPNRITQVKTVENDGYRALQVSAGKRKASRVSKPQAGHFAQAKVEAGDLITEFRLDDADEGEFETGHEIKVDLFEAGQKVDVIGTSIGKGYAGTVKRHNFRTQDATHGNSLSHRAPGSIGQNQTPGRVFKGKKMSGHMGNARSTVQNLEVVRVDAERNLLLIKGAVPGHRGGRVIVRPAVKARGA
jgi:large subunit ribosomal protein L3